MGLISTEVEINLHGNNIPYYENLGYEIPRIKKQWVMRTPRGTKITVKTKDLLCDSHVFVNVQCDSCGKIYEIQYRNYYHQNHQGEIYCHKCFNSILHTGKNNFNWKPEKTDEERNSERKNPEYVTFIKNVLARDNYTCQCCGKQFTSNLQVHHLYGYAGYPEYRTDQKQALTLCENCHKSFHSWHQHKFGFAEKGKCVPKQFEEWFGKAIAELQNYNGNLPTVRQVYDIEEDKIYRSAIEYANIHKVQKSQIYACCNHRIINRKYINRNGEISYHKVRVNTVSGHHLLWLDEYLQMSKEDLKNLKEFHSQKSIGRAVVNVICVTTGKYFDSIIDASNYYKINKTGISACCRGKQKTAGKLNGVPLKWMYLSDFKKLPQEEQEKILANVKEELS